MYNLIDRFWYWLMVFFNADCPAGMYNNMVRQAEVDAMTQIRART